MRSPWAASHFVELLPIAFVPSRHAFSLDVLFNPLDAAGVQKVHRGSFRRLFPERRFPWMLRPSRRFTGVPSVSKWTCSLCSLARGRPSFRARAIHIRQPFPGEAFSSPVVSNTLPADLFRVSPSTGRERCHPVSPPTKTAGGIVRLQQRIC